MSEVYPLSVQGKTILQSVGSLLCDDVTLDAPLPGTEIQSRKWSIELTDRPR